MFVKSGTVLLSLILAFSSSITAQVPEPDSLGDVEFAVACKPEVQREFNRGVALLHHMTYPAAYEVFTEVARRDPACGMAFWGMAATLFQPLWPTRPTPDELNRGWELAQRAVALAPEDPVQRQFIAAVATFFDPDGAGDYWARIDRWAAVQADLYRRAPDHREVAAFNALAILATASRSGDAAAHHREAARILSEILKSAPHHPGAVHYTIHANDFDGREHEALDVVRGYADIAPRNPHALHMPTHIFVRLGDWPAVIDWNMRAAEAALAQHVGPDGQYVWDEYPHATEYLVYAYLQRGDDVRAKEAIGQLQAIPNLQPSFKTAFHLASTPARYALERQDWKAAADLPTRQPPTLPWDRFWWPEAVVWHARGLGAAHLGDSTAAARSEQKLKQLEEAARAAGEAYFATQIQLLGLEVAAWRAHAGGKSAEGARLLRSAVELEESTPKHPVTPGPSIPARELLGDLYFDNGQFAKALDEYRRVQERAPNRLNTLLGAARAAEKLGSTAEAAHFVSAAEALTIPGSPRPGLRHVLRLDR